MIKLTAEQAHEILATFAEYVMFEGQGEKRKRKPATSWECDWEELEYGPGRVGLAIEALLEIEI